MHVSTNRIDPSTSLHKQVLDGAYDDYDIHNNDDTNDTHSHNNDADNDHGIHNNDGNDNSKNKHGLPSSSQYDVA
ncbi:predicted protein [Lichtheimia corymbifera JMRC:FSU:9682]|uniref:Uncharacterized protein n=1 Tax=Lichtheimia corymbifera JMRC:FSU:9682 TaxID=1263082 RepID=A0A068S106_9FUNG|nr:predicted protein [Lichtheimia corymbifera JMRC:FSU:9682]